MQRYTRTISIAMPEHVIKKVSDSPHGRSHTVRTCIDKALNLPESEQYPVNLPHGTGVRSITISTSDEMVSAVKDFAKRKHQTLSRAALSLLIIGLNQN